MRLRLRAPHVLLGVAFLALAAVGLALVAQYRFDMPPCVWCVFQRLVFVVLAAAALLAALLPGALRRLFAALAVGLAACGVAAALWQNFYAARQPSCDLTLADRIVSALQLDRLLPQVFVAFASCADASVSVLGVPFALWSCAMFVLLGALCAWTIRHAGGGRAGTR